MVNANYYGSYQMVLPTATQNFPRTSVWHSLYTYCHVAPCSTLRAIDNGSYHWYAWYTVYTCTKYSIHCTMVLEYHGSVQWRGIPLAGARYMYAS
jgi:hypothetical protein